LNASAILKECSRRGVAVELESGRVRLRGDLAGLGRGLMDVVRANRDAIVTVLESRYASHSDQQECLACPETVLTDEETVLTDEGAGRDCLQQEPVIVDDLRASRTPLADLGHRQGHTRVAGVLQTSESQQNEPERLGARRKQNSSTPRTLRTLTTTTNVAQPMLSATPPRDRQALTGACTSAVLSPANCPKCPDRPLAPWNWKSLAPHRWGPSLHHDLPCIDAGRDRPLRPL
jgi:hypothetical protein